MLLCMVFGVLGAGFIFLGQKVMDGKVFGSPAIWRKKAIGDGYRIILLNESFGRVLGLMGSAFIVMCLYMYV